MLCPYCGREMEEGFVPFNSPLILKWFSCKGKRRVRVSDKVKWYEVAKIKHVHYCEACRVFIKKS